MRLEPRLLQSRGWSYSGWFVRLPCFAMGSPLSCGTWRCMIAFFSLRAGSTSHDFIRYPTQAVQTVSFTQPSMSPVVQTEHVFEASFIESVNKLIKLGRKTNHVFLQVLGVMLFLFSGVWPHIKLLLLGICWTARLDPRQRQLILYWADRCVCVIW